MGTTIAKKSLSGKRLDFYLGRHWEGQLRDASGRFCTGDTYKRERTANENKRLAYDNAMLQRKASALAKEYSRLLRENNLLKSILKENGLEFCNVAGSDRQ